MMEYYFLGKFVFFILFPVNTLFRQRVAIEIWGLEKYKKSSGKELFTNISWRDSENPFFRATILFTNYGMFFSILFFVVGLVFKRVF